MLLNFANDNFMVLSFEKCIATCLSHKISPSIPQHFFRGKVFATCVKDLGIFLDSRLTFAFHYDFIVSRANKKYSNLDCFVLNFCSLYLEEFALYAVLKDRL